MSQGRYEVRRRIVIDAPIARVYALAIDPHMVPKYAGEIVRIVRKTGFTPAGHGSPRFVQSHIRICGITMCFDYRYRYVPPKYYGGVQVRGKLARGYFSLRFKSIGDGAATEVEHVEGITSLVPLLGRFVGWIWFRVLSPDGPGDELRKLKELVESAMCDDDAATPRPATAAHADV